MSVGDIALIQSFVSDNIELHFVPPVIPREGHLEGMDVLFDILPYDDTIKSASFCKSIP